MIQFYGDPHRILGLTPNATEKEVRKAYRLLAMKYHPDRNPEDPETEEKFKQVQWAYEKLTRHNREESLSLEEIRRRQNELYFSKDVHPIFYFFQAMRGSANCQKKKDE